MTPLHQAAQMALDALEAALSDDQPYIERCKDAVTALREALAAPPAAPAPAGWVMVPRGLLRRLIAEALTFDPSLQDKEAIEQAKQLAASPAAPAAPPAAPAPAQPVPLTQDQIADCTRTAHRACDAKGPMTRWSTEFARAIEAAHGITGGSK